jgi:hypothetical protein
MKPSVTGQICSCHFKGRSSPNGNFSVSRMDRPDPARAEKRKRGGKPEPVVEQPKDALR